MLPKLNSLTMSTTAGAAPSNGNGHVIRPGSNIEGTEIAQPRARRPANKNPSLARALHGELSDGTPVPSGPSTPAPPDDAPPSVKATSAARRTLRQQRRLFPTVEYESRVSYFDPRSEYSNFRGFFVLFWVGLAIMVITAVLRNLKDSGDLLSFRQWPLFTKNIWEMGLIDLLMCASTGLSLPLHLIFKNSKGWLRWNRAGMAIQSVFQAVWLAFWICYPFMRDWSWTAQVFITLHTL